MPISSTRYAGLLLAELARCKSATILELYGVVFPDNLFRLGIIASTQTFGDLLICHLHIHNLVADPFGSVEHSAIPREEERTFRKPVLLHRAFKVKLVAF